MAGQSRYETQEPRFTEEEAANYKRPSPHVLIIGAGMAGLYLAILLEEANISYQLFERTTKIKPLGKFVLLNNDKLTQINAVNIRLPNSLHRCSGAVLSLNCGILPSFEQLNLYEDLLKISLPVASTDIYKESMKKISNVPAEGINKV
jgi:hypothetical protein